MFTELTSFLAHHPSLPIALATSAGVASGTTYAFSTFVMRGLGRLSEADAIRAMQAINETAISGAFLAVLVGTGPALGLYAAARASLGTGSGWLWSAAAVFVVGVVGVTVAGNVPLNEALDRVVADQAAPGTWQAYARPWLRYNHLRTAMAAASCALVITSLLDAS